MIPAHWKPDLSIRNSYGSSAGPMFEVQGDTLQGRALLTLFCDPEDLPVDGRWGIFAEADFLDLKRRAALAGLSFATERRL